MDTDGEGVLEVPLLLSVSFKCLSSFLFNLPALLQMLKDSKGPDLAEALVSCHTLPGAMDVYVTDKSLVSADLGIDLVKVRKCIHTYTHTDQEYIITRVSNLQYPRRNTVYKVT